MFLGYIDPGTGFTIFNLGAWVIALLVGFSGTLLLLLKRILGFIKKYREGRSIIVLVLIILGLITIGVAMNKKNNFDKKIIIIGLDGLDPVIAEHMMEKDELPNFTQLKKYGSYHRLSTTNPPQSPVAWAAFATGQNPGKNGICDFIIRDPRTYGLDLSISNIKNEKSRKVVKGKRFWEYLSQKKIPATIITCPLTFPADRIYGRMLSGMGVPDILGTEGTFTFYTTEGLSRDTKDTGGNTFQIAKSSIMALNFIGPKVGTIGAAPKNLKVPFQVILQKDQNSIVIEYQHRRLQLKEGNWSDWQEVTFRVGLFKDIKGIFKFYLAEINPEFKLFITPINLDPRDPFLAISYPNNYSKELTKNIGLYYTQGMPFNSWAVNEGRLGDKPFLEEAKEILQEKTAMLRFELKRFKKGFLFCYFEDLDIIQHMFWRYIDPEHPLYRQNAPEEYKKIIEKCYIKMDGILGGVMKNIARDDVLIVLSDHGFNTFRRAVHLNSWLKENGYLELKKLNTDTEKELLGNIDWAKTKAYAIGFGSIYINQQDREKKGIVKPGAETALLKEEISQKLKQWIDEEYDKLVICNVYKRNEIFWGNYLDQMPDLYIGFNTGYRASWQTALGGVPKELIEDNLKKWSGEHLFDPSLVPGVLFSNKKITKTHPSIYDLAPTILKIAGDGEKELQKYDLDGEPLF